MLEVQDISVQIKNKYLLRGVSACFRPGECTVILGPNGSGKSSFIKAVSGISSHASGSVRYDEQSMASFSKQALSKKRAVFSQHSLLNFPMLVEEVIMMGRYPYFDSVAGKHDQQICDAVIGLLGLETLIGRDYLTLSGGEQQRTHLARVLVQLWEKPAEGARYLFLDEPVSSLDIRHQHQLLAIAQQLTAQGFAIIAVLHDINLAMQYADHVMLFKEGRLLHAGPPEKVITKAIIEEIFETAVSIVSTPASNRPLVVFQGGN
jgi:iron complex transport system ATP-binding protein